MQERQHGENQGTVSIDVATHRTSNESSKESHHLDARAMSALERRRLELEYGAGGDHDLPYTFTLPHFWPQVLAWMKLLAKVHSGALPP